MHGLSWAESLVIGAIVHWKLLALAAACLLVGVVAFFRWWR